ncbi:MAG TPA: ROK family protein [Anaerolineae bacterium]|nr:ROK family protein [Anaerolineae bacterium]
MTKRELMTGDPPMMRRLNRATVLKLIRSRGPISRTALVHSTGLAPRTVFSIVEELVGVELVRSSGIGRTRVGRRPLLYEFNPTGYALVGVEVRADEVLALVTDLDAQVLGRASGPMSSDLDRTQGLALIASTIREAWISADRRPERLLGIGVATPGLVDCDHGIVRQAVNLQWRYLALGPALGAEFNVPVWIESVAKAMALGEHLFGNARGVSDLVCMNVGGGVGAGIIMNDMLLRGPDNAAGEVGHTTVDHDGPLCSCGNRGCLEVLVATPAIACRMAMLMGPEVEGLARASPDRVVARLAREAEAGDALALRIVDEVGGYLGIGVANLVNLVNPEAVIIGGVLASLGELLLKKVRTTVSARALGMLSNRVRILPTALGPDAGAIGGAALVLLREDILPTQAFLSGQAADALDALRSPTMASGL